MIDAVGLQITGIPRFFPNCCPFFSNRISLTLAAGKDTPAILPASELRAKWVEGKSVITRRSGR